MPDPQANQVGQTDSQPFPWNRVVALLGPFVAAASGAVAAWLLRHFPGVKIDKATLATSISEALVFAVTAIGSLALHHKWLSGWQQYEQRLGDAGQVAAQTPSDAPPPGRPAPADEEPKVTEPVQDNGQPQDDATVSEPVQGNGQAQDDGTPGVPPGVVNLVKAVLPTDIEEMASVPTTQHDGTQNDGPPAQQPETAVTPDPPVNELRPAAA